MRIGESPLHALCRSVFCALFQVVVTSGGSFRSRQLFPRLEKSLRRDFNTIVISHGIIRFEIKKKRSVLYTRREILARGSREESYRDGETLRFYIRNARRWQIEFRENFPGRGDRYWVIGIDIHERLSRCIISRIFSAADIGLTFFFKRCGFRALTLYTAESFLYTISALR